MENLTDDYSNKIDTIHKVFNLAINIGKSYKDAEPSLKRFYLDLFWEGFDVENGKIRKSRLSKALKPLLLSESVRVRDNMLLG